MLQKPCFSKSEAKGAPRKVRSSLPEVSKKKAAAAARVPQLGVAQAQRKRVKKEPVGRSALAKESAQLQLSKDYGDEVGYMKTAMGEVYAELTRYLSALKRRLEAVVSCHYSVLETSPHIHRATFRKTALRYRQTSFTGRQIVQAIGENIMFIRGCLDGAEEAAATGQRARA